MNNPLVCIDAGRSRADKVYQWQHIATATRLRGKFPREQQDSSANDKGRRKIAINLRRDKHNHSAKPKLDEEFFGENGVANGIRTRNNKLHKLGLYH
jgi:hypothetical protein